MVQVHRKGRVYQQQGKTLTWTPGEPFKVKCKKRLEFFKHTNPVAFRELAEQVLIELVAYLQNRNGGEAVELWEIQREGSFKVGVSPETIKRYVWTHTAEGAELKMVGKKVKLNPLFVADDEDEEEE